MLVWTAPIRRRCARVRLLGTSPGALQSRDCHHRIGERGFGIAGRMRRLRWRIAWFRPCQLLPHTVTPSPTAGRENPRKSAAFGGCGACPFAAISATATRWSAAARPTSCSPTVARRPRPAPHRPAVRRGARRRGLHDGPRARVAEMRVRHRRRETCRRGCDH